MNINFEEIVYTTYILKIFFISICTYFTFLKIINEKISNTKSNIIAIIFLFITCCIVKVLKQYFNSFIAIITLVFLISLICSYITKNKVGYSILISIISASFNYTLFFITIIIGYIINGIYPIYNDYVNLSIMILLHIILLYKIFKIKKLKNGISFFNKIAQDEYFDVIILNISVSILLSIVIIPYMNINTLKTLSIGIIIFTTIMIITIYRTLQLYYKHKLLVKELEETTLELKNTKQENLKLEKDNLDISEKIHTLSHRQETLEYKIEKLDLKPEEKLDLKGEIKELSDEIYKPELNVNLTKTGINQIDDTLEYMKSKCDKNNIEFNLQVIGNIYHMTNNLIETKELSTLISDHVKDAIIAINHSNNVNKSILVKLGKIDENYGLYIYDSGVEFDKEALKHLGKIPYTTYKNEGGTGLGFMNTFKILNKYKASLIIHEIGKPSKENFTKIIMLKFDGKNEFKIN